MGTRWRCSPSCSGFSTTVKDTTLMRMNPASNGQKYRSIHKFPSRNLSISFNNEHVTEGISGGVRFTHTLWGTCQLNLTTKINAYIVLVVCGTVMFINCCWGTYQLAQVIIFKIHAGIYWLLDHLSVDWLIDWFIMIIVIIAAVFVIVTDTDGSSVVDTW